MYPEDEIIEDDELTPEELALYGLSEEEDDDSDYEELTSEDLEVAEPEEVQKTEEVDGRDLLHEEVANEISKDSSIAQEYQASFTEEERITSVLNSRSDSFKVSHGVVSLLELSPTLPLKESRRQTYKGLTQSVKELGILTPIHVMLTEGYKSYLEAGDFSEPWTKEEFGDKYILIDGFRRVWAGLTNKMTEAPAVIWDFKDMDLAMELLTPLSLLLNKTQHRDWKETWGLYQILETTSLMTPATLEYLLQLQPGDAMKLKDVMLCEYDEVREDLLRESKTLQQCYNTLQKLRKEENQLELDDQRGLSEVEGADGVVGDMTSGEGQLSYNEVKKLLEFDDEEIENLSDEDFEDLAGKEDEGVVIDRRKGEDIPRELKQAALARDNYTCQISGTGLDGGLSMTLALSILQVHHIIPLYLGGKNTLDNLVTVRMDLHTWIHVAERLGGKIGMSPEQFKAMEFEKKKELYGALQYGKLIVDEIKRQGKSVTDKALQQASYEATRFKMPGTDLKENVAAIREHEELVNA